MNKTKGFKITDSQAHTLIGTLLFGKCPIVYPASVSALKKAGLMFTTHQGNLELTAIGLEVALSIFKNKSVGVSKRTQLRIAKLKLVA